MGKGDAWDLDLLNGRTGRRVKIIVREGRTSGDHGFLGDSKGKKRDDAPGSLLTRAQRFGDFEIIPQVKHSPASMRSIRTS